MKTYQLTEEGINRLSRQVAGRLLSVYALAFLAMVGFSWWREDQNWVVTLACGGLLIGGLFFIIGWRGVKNSREMLGSIRIEVGEAYISRSQARAETVTIRRDEITHVSEVPRGLVVHTADKNRVIGVPEALDPADWAEIRQVLAGWSDIRPQSGRDQMLRVLLFIALLAGFAVIFLSKSLVLVIVAGLALIGFYGYLAWRIRQTAGIDSRFRWQFNIMTGVMVLLFALKIIALLM